MYCGPPIGRLRSAPWALELLATKTNVQCEMVEAGTYTMHLCGISTAHHHRHLVRVQTRTRPGVRGEEL
jgi:hypothetical protein